MNSTIVLLSQWRRHVTSQHKVLPLALLRDKRNLVRSFPVSPQ